MSETVFLGLDAIQLIVILGCPILLLIAIWLGITAPRD